MPPKAETGSVAKALMNAVSQFFRNGYAARCGVFDYHARGLIAWPASNAVQSSVSVDIIIVRHRFALQRFGLC